MGSELLMHGPILLMALGWFGLFIYILVQCVRGK